MSKTKEEMAREYSQKEWDDYQEHLLIGGNKLHVRSFCQLGFHAGHASRDAEVAELKQEIERLHSYVIAGYQEGIAELERRLVEMSTCGHPQTTGECKPCATLQSHMFEAQGYIEGQDKEIIALKERIAELERKNLWLRDTYFNQKRDEIKQLKKENAELVDALAKISLGHEYGCGSNEGCRCTCRAGIAERALLKVRGGE